MKKIFLALSCVLSLNSFAGVDPSELLIKVYQVAIALNEDCSNPIVLYTSASGTETNFLDNPILGTATLSDGTYNCVMITMDDVIKFKPNANVGGVCVSGTQYTADLCRNQASSSGVALMSHTDLLLGTSSTYTECSGTSSYGGGASANKVTMYLRTTSLSFSDPDSQNTQAWMKGVAGIGDAGGGNPTAPKNNGIQLQSPFVKNGRVTGVFYVDASGFVDDESGHCGLMGAKFGFRNP